MNPITRREWIAVTGSAAFAQPLSPDRRIAEIIRDYGDQGIHRTATDVDRASGEWLMSLVRAAGLEPRREFFSIDRIDSAAAFFKSGDRKIEGLPLFDGGFTSGAGIRGRLGVLGSDAEIGLAEAPPNASAAGELGEARRNNRHQAIVLVTRGGRPGLCPNNAESFLHPFGPPILQVSSEDKPWLDECARNRSEAVFVAQVKRKRAEAFNVLAEVAGSDPSLPPLIVMTLRSGWWSCASERGGGIVCWLELMRAFRHAKRARTVRFVASSGHEIGQLGIEIHAERRPELVKGARGWIHFGANIGAAQNASNTIQASDDEMRNLLASTFMSSGIKVDRRVPQGTVPGGEAGVIHRGGGRYMSLIGGNALFHNPGDRGAEAVDVAAIARFARVFTEIAKTLASAEEDAA
jgi:hypothetical protein